MKIADIFTLIRIILAPVFLIIYFVPEWFGFGTVLSVWILLPLIIFAEFTDFLDGYFARKYNQVELAETDAKILGINPPRRQSGDLEGSLPITIIGPNGKVDLSSGAILAERHIHMDPIMAKRVSLEDKQEMEVYKEDKYLFNAIIKISEPAALEIHIDTDEAEAYKKRGRR